MKIEIKEIRVDTKVSIRERNDEETIERYEDNLENLPPIVVFRTGDKYLLADGFHRVAAAKRLGWKEIEGVVKEGSYDDAVEFGVKANIKHGNPLTLAEYERGLKRLKYLHKDWTQQKLASVLERSQQWVSSVLAADRVGKVLRGSTLDTRTKAEISRAPKELWGDIGRRAEEQDWTRDETQEKVKEIKEEPSRAQEILHQPEMLIQIPEAPADKLIPLTKEIDKLCEMLDPSLYDWGSGALGVHVLHGLYVLAEKMKKMIDFLEARK